MIVAFGGREVAAGRDLGALVRQQDPGDRVEVDVVLGGGARRTFTVILGVNPVPTA